MVATGPTDLQLRRLAQRVIRQRSGLGETIVTAESCTGGWIGKCLTEVAGSSAVYLAGHISYSNAAKQCQLGVTAKLLARQGAVSEAVATAMAKGALKAAGSDWAVAVTGIAGPAGGTPGKPVGTVWLAWAHKGPGRRINVSTSCHQFRGDRDAVRRRAVAVALRGLLLA